MGFMGSGTHQFWERLLEYNHSSMENEQQIGTNFNWRLGTQQFEFPTKTLVMGFASFLSNKLKTCTQSQSTSVPTILKLINDVTGPQLFTTICPQFKIITNLFFLKTLEKALL